MKPASAKHLLEQFSDELLRAAVTLEPVAPLRDRLNGMTLNDAYAVQTMQLDRHLKNGRILAGRKVGLTSVAMQKQLGVDSPDFGSSSRTWSTTRAPHCQTKPSSRPRLSRSSDSC